MMVATLLHLLDNPIATTPERISRARHRQAIAIGNTSFASINSSGRDVEVSTLATSPHSFLLFSLLCPQ